MFPLSESCSDLNDLGDCARPRGVVGVLIGITIGTQMAYGSLYGHVLRLTVAAVLPGC